MTLPKSIKIGGMRYSVTEVLRLIGRGKDGTDTWLNGSITYHDCRIEIEEKVDPQMQVAVLWHEALHGVLEQAGQEQSESLIQALGYGIVQLIRDNPELVALTINAGLQPDQDGHKE